MSSTSALNCMLSPSLIVRRMERRRLPMTMSSYNQFSAFQTGISLCFAGSGLGFFIISIEMKNFLQRGPDFAGRAVGQQLQTWHAFSPPPFRDWIINHQRHVRRNIVADVFKITEQIR